MIMWTPPPSQRMIGSVTINGVEVKAKMMELKVTRVAIHAVASCDIILRNLNGEYNNVFNQNDTVVVKADYVDGTTRIFEGIVHDIENEAGNLNKINIKALGYEEIALKKIVNKVYTSPTKISDIFKTLISENMTGFTTTNVSTIDITATPVFVDKPLFDCLKELMTLAGDDYTFYCDFDKDWHVFEKGAVFNSIEAIMFKGNMITCTVSKDINEVINAVIIYGQDQKGMPLLVTEIDQPSIDKHGRRERSEKNSNITNITFLKEKAKKIIETSKNLETKGTASCLGMATLQPGDSVQVFLPEQNLINQEFVTKFTHKIRGRGFNTEVNFQEKSRNIKEISDIFKFQEEGQQKIRDVINPFNMRNSYVVLFSESGDVESLTNCVQDSGFLKTATGESSGNMVTATHTANDNITKAHLKIRGEDLNNVTALISVDNGVSYETIASETEYNVVGVGNKLKIKLELNSTNVRVESCGILYR